MREKLIASAISCLYNDGYSAATTLNVQKKAGVSRGALVHHFPTRADLLIAVAKKIIEEQTKFYISELEKIGDNRERYLQIIAIAWKALKKPSGMALLEILLGCRSDEDLSVRLAPVIRDLTAFQRQGMWYLAKGAGATDRAAVQSANDLCLAALRGLSIQLLYDDDPDATESSVTLLLHWARKWLAETAPADTAMATLRALR
ncbi:TetR/AcrR family transcriptional regulator [Ponticaulis profundi]|uniref:TetR/AcrR family transcriptional regulator n=1 Tax=Ponticaulis profundi TaxID=2665222 RepID=A0ABW1SB25_9PROT